MRDNQSDWLESRTGLRTLRDTILREPIRGGARWRHVFGTALAGTFLIQAVTGWLLMTTYVPSATQAWGSVWYIQHEMVLGWFIRGLHHHGSSAMMVLLGLHLFQVVLTAAYRAPREVNWWLGLALMGLVLGFSLTGYLLPWDQKGYWATRVATNIAGSTPVLGPAILKLLIGGSDYGSLTLTRLFSLHVGLLPLLMLSLLALHVALYYRHGATAPESATRVEPSWPGQSFRNLVALGVVMAFLVGMTLWQHGANLEAPADPTRSDYPARPEWYFLSLFQLLNHMVSPYEVVGTHVLPGLLMGFLAALPLLDRVLPRRLVQASAVVVVGLVALSVGFLTAEALDADSRNTAFQRARVQANIQRERALFLASRQGVAPDGAINLLRRDPLTQGRDVLDRNCLVCHAHAGKGQSTYLDFTLRPGETDSGPAGGGARIAGIPEPAARAVAAKLPDFKHDGLSRGPGARGIIPLSGTDAEGRRVDISVDPAGTHIEAVVWSKQSAADLDGFGTEAWIRGLLEDPSSPKYFGATPALGGMARWKKSSKLTPAELDAVAAFVAALGQVEPGESLDDWYTRAYGGSLEQHPGQAAFLKECGKCHVIGEPGLIADGGLEEAPDLFGYASRDWLETMILDPAAETHYGFLEEADRMPAFKDRLTANDLDMVIRYLQRDYLTPDQPAPEAAPGTDLPAPR